MASPADVEVRIYSVSSSSSSSSLSLNGDDDDDDDDEPSCANAHEMLADSERSCAQAEARAHAMRRLADRLIDKARIEESAVRREQEAAGRLRAATVAVVAAAHSRGESPRSTVFERSAVPKSAGSAISHNEAAAGRVNRPATGALFARAHELTRENRALRAELEGLRRQLLELEAANQSMVVQLRTRGTATPTTMHAASAGAHPMALKRTSRVLGALGVPTKFPHDETDAPGAGRDAESAFTCATCASTYESAEMLERHVLLRHGDNSGCHRCTVCNNAYESAELLNRHRYLRQHHHDDADGVDDARAPRSPAMRLAAGSASLPSSNQSTPVLPRRDAHKEAPPDRLSMACQRDPAELEALFNAAPPGAWLRVQAVSRGWLARRLARQLRRRSDIVDELLNTEHNYVEGLKLVLREYHQPMSARVGTASEIAPRAVLKAIFCNLPDIARLHERLLQTLRAQAASPSWRSEIAPAFADMDALSMYATYVNNFLVARDTLEEQRKTNARFSAFISRPLRNMLDVNDILISPVQRIPRYKMLLADLWKHTPCVHPDHAGLRAVLDTVTALAASINDGKRQYEEMASIMARVSGAPAKLTLVEPHRVLLLRCPLLDDRMKPRVGLLFNDLLLECKDFDEPAQPASMAAAAAASAPSHDRRRAFSPPRRRLQPEPLRNEPGTPVSVMGAFFKRSSPASGLKVKRHVVLRHSTTVASLPDFSVGRYARNVFQVTDPAAKEVIVFCAPSLELKKQWMQAIRDAVMEV